MPRSYRIRWAVVDTRDGKRRMCLAEAQISLFWGLFKEWWPVTDGGWRRYESEAREDIARDREIRAPLPPTIYIE